MMTRGAFLTRHTLVREGRAMIDRRAFLGALALLAAPLGAEAQQLGKVRRAGILQPLPNTPVADYTSVSRSILHLEECWAERRHLLPKGLRMRRMRDTRLAALSRGGESD